jgi:hypothetical protein
MINIAGRCSPVISWDCEMDAATVAPAASKPQAANKVRARIERFNDENGFIWIYRDLFRLSSTTRRKLWQLSENDSISATTALAVRNRRRRRRLAF